MIAYVDESLRLGGDGRYVLAAVVVPRARADEVRDVLRSALRRGQRRFHFRKQSDAGRLAMSARIGALGLRSVVVVHPVDAARQERARRLCLTRLLWELDQRGIRHVVMESRRDRDSLDVEMVRHVRRAGWVSDRLRCDFASPEAECLLWLADVVAGATRLRGDGDPTCFDALGDGVTLVTEP